MSQEVIVQTMPFNAENVRSDLLKISHNVGAIVSFEGWVRTHDQAIPLSHLWLEHFPKVTEKVIQTVIDEAKQRFEIESCRVIHRVGQLMPNEAIVLVMVAAAHRKAAFQAAEFLMDYLKTSAPFWKCEHFLDGSFRWVDAKQKDYDAALQWQK